MKNSYDLLIQGGTCALPGGTLPADIGICNGRIMAIGNLSKDDASEIIKAHGLHVLPGVIDSQVHFREPGLEHKEDFETGTAGAVLGGVVAVMEMPNTKPPTVKAAALADKCRRAKGRAWCDMAFFIGATMENVEQLSKLERLPGCAGIKVFMGSSTGNLLVKDDATLLQVLLNGTRRIAVHCEDEFRLRKRFSLVEEGANVAMHMEWRDVETARLATERLLQLAKGAKRRIHVLHVTTAEEITLLTNFKDLATVECTPQHLTLSAPDAYERLGTMAQMNPPIRSERHRSALWRAIENGVIDCIGSDHAPHTKQEKNQPYPQSPSGMTGVQTLVPIMLDHVAAGRLSLERFIDLTSAGPARIYNIAGKGRIALGYDADFTIVDLKTTRTITNQWIASRCGWTPFDGKKVTGWPVTTIIRGNIAMHDGQILDNPIGDVIRFQESL